MTEEMTPRPEVRTAFPSTRSSWIWQRQMVILRLDYTIFRPHNVYGERRRTSQIRIAT